MDRLIHVNCEEGEEITVEFGDFSTYFEPYPSYLLTNAAGCTIDVNDNHTESFEADQTIIDSVGDVINLEREKLRNVIDSFNTLDYTLASLYQQR